MFVEVVVDKFAAPVCVSVRKPTDPVRKPTDLLHRPDCPHFQHQGAKMRLATPWELRTLRACRTCQATVTRELSGAWPRRRSAA
jgi:hypothetical protein